MTVGDFPVRGKIAVVTGAGSGINLAYAKLAEKYGAKVIVADLRLTPDAEDFIKTKKGTVIFVVCDVSKRADLENLTHESKEHFGDVPDVWIAGAGVFEPSWSNFWDDSEGDGYKEVDINLNHPLKLSRIAIRTLLGANKPGVILILASIAGYRGHFATPLYCATKHACVGFVRSMAELDRLENIKVTLVAPGLVNTPLWTERPEKIKQHGYNANDAVSAEEVATVMMDLVTNGTYGGGSCMQVAVGETRLLGTWNIDPPNTRGSVTGPDALNESYLAVLDILQNEKAS